MTALRQATYSPAIFNVGDINQAKRIILTTEGELSTDRRWREETPYLLSLIEANILLHSESVVLDYGCGIGRMSKVLIEKFGCRVVGVDISPSMRALAASYVSSERFIACAPEALKWIGIDFDMALAVWVLQHCYQVEADIARISGALKAGASMFIVNDRKRIVPTREQGWANDGLDVLGLLRGSFASTEDYDLDPSMVGETIARVSYWAIGRKAAAVL